MVVKLLVVVMVVMVVVVDDFMVYLPAVAGFIACAALASAPPCSA